MTFSPLAAAQPLTKLSWESLTYSLADVNKRRCPFLSLCLSFSSPCRSGGPGSPAVDQKLESLRP